MKKILLIILLTTVSSIEYIAKAQGFKAEERQKIVNYVNCYYTARYILNNPDYKQENKAIEKYKINVDSVEDAYEYDTLYGYLKESGVLDYTADRLTKKLNDRNSSVTDSFYIVDYINKITDTDDFRILNLLKKINQNLQIRFYNGIYRDIVKWNLLVKIELLEMTT